ncbi:MAG: hypothetical protein HQ475_12800 [SAR202 cluster bacterium]|nr:hypothetical protein [SAR202 cluster bacterium]
MPDLKFINNVIKPWDDLNDLLAYRYALEPGLSDVTRMATSLASSINHYGEPDIRPEMLAQDCPDMGLIRDIADASKHIKLRDARRQNEVYVRSNFEVRDDGQFCFLRNSILVEHATAGELDFMTVALASIRFWIGRLGLDVGVWSGEIKEANQEFYPTAWLEFEPKYCINMRRTSVRMLKREDGVLTKFDPQIEIVEVYRD